MAKCSRCCLHYSLRIVNVSINFVGVLMIIYSLWALKKWNAEETAEGSSDSGLLDPWFLFAFLGIGIVVCLSTLFGHVVANSISVFVLTIYILFVCAILFLQVGVIIVIFFKKDWISEIHEDFVGQHAKFKKFVIFHLALCRYVALVIALTQAVSFVLAVMLWAWGPEPNSRCEDSSSHDVGSPGSSLNQSFLICSSSHLALPAPWTNYPNDEKKTLIEEIG